MLQEKKNLYFNFLIFTLVFTAEMGKYTEITGKEFNISPKRSFHLPKTQQKASFAKIKVAFYKWQ